MGEESEPTDGPRERQNKLPGLSPTSTIHLTNLLYEALRQECGMPESQLDSKKKKRNEKKRKKKKKSTVINDAIRNINSV
jgi:hypothetical protein